MTSNELSLRTRPQESKGLLDVVYSLRYDRKYTDLEIHCQDKVFKVHKAIVCQQVDFLAACVDGPFEESQTGIIQLEDDIPEIVGHLIDFLYTEDYQVLDEIDGLPRSQFPAATNSELLVHCHVYTLADKFLVTKLKELAVVNFRALLDRLKHSEFHLFTPVLKTAFEDSPHDDRGVKSYCLVFAGRNFGHLCRFRDFKAFCKQNGQACFEIAEAVHFHSSVMLEDEKNANTIPDCQECNDANDVRVSSVNDVKKWGGKYYCTYCKKNFSNHGDEYYSSTLPPVSFTGVETS